jgi:hypothetical protein
MRSLILIISLLLFTTGCSVTKNNEWMMGSLPVDSLQEPCIKCNEDWIFIQNEPHRGMWSSKRKGYDSKVPGSWSKHIRY